MSPKRGSGWKSIKLGDGRVWALPAGIYRGTVVLSPFARALVDAATIDAELRAAGLTPTRITMTSRGAVVVAALPEARTVTLPTEISKLEVRR